MAGTPGARAPRLRPAAGAATLVVGRPGGPGWRAGPGPGPSRRRHRRPPWTTAGTTRTGRAQRPRRRLAPFHPGSAGRLGGQPRPGPQGRVPTCPGSPGAPGRALSQEVLPATAGATHAQPPPPVRSVINALPSGARGCPVTVTEACLLEATFTSRSLSFFLPLEETAWRLRAATCPLPSAPQSVSAPVLASVRPTRAPPSWPCRHPRARHQLGGVVQRCPGTPAFLAAPLPASLHCDLDLTVAQAHSTSMAVRRPPRSYGPALTTA